MNQVRYLCFQCCCQDVFHWARLNHAIGFAYQVNENIVISGDLNSDLMSGATPIDKPYIVITEWNATILF
jgi:hypothetical protein